MVGGFPYEVAEGFTWIAGFLVVWFAIMAVTGWLAGRKGRSDGDWALLALILGPIALALVILLPRRVPDPD